MGLQSPPMCRDSGGRGKKLTFMEKHLLCANCLLFVHTHLKTTPKGAGIVATIFQMGKLRPQKMTILSKVTQ